MVSGFLVGRAEEQHAIRSLISGARNGLGGAVVVRGEPGIGKTALVGAATGELTGTQLIRVDGYQAESSIPFAGLQRIGSLLDPYVSELSVRHRAALNVAWGTEEGPVPDRFLVGLAMLALCGRAGAHTPLVCVMDDA